MSEIAITDFPAERADSRVLVWATALLLLAVGIFIRAYPSAGFTGTGFDEHLYQRYVAMLNAKGITAYPDICEYFIQEQSGPGIAELPPTRFLYIYCGHLWSMLTGAAPLAALGSVSCLFSMLILIPSALFARRLRGDGAMLGTLALMCFAPVQIHLGQHRMIDGFFAFWALMCLWLLWENLRAPNHAGWLAGLTACLALMVMTKENAFFVFVALGGVVVLNRWAKWGEVTPRLLLCMSAGALLGFVTLVSLAGGVGVFIRIYQILVTKAQALPYAIQTGDGPWYRYFVDYMLVSPIVLLLAVGGMFSAARESKPLLYLAAFMACGYVLMCNVKYGLNLRYTTIWDMPLRLLAWCQLVHLTQRFRAQQPLALAVLCACLCAYELRQYMILFHDSALYELVPGGILFALKILKPAAAVAH
jgi:4-amino-4-deoxy-L-arabinose transferase-like glycosyltransferase